MDVVDSFEEPRPERAGALPETLVVDLDGYEGPLDVLLGLAREQKVDLKRISILQLADQYLAFVERARRINLEIAAEYLVMAAWLAYLKSKLLLPEPETDQPTGEEMAARLAFQLQRLESIRDLGGRLMARDRAGIDVFLRGNPDGIRVIRQNIYECSLYELLKAYGEHKESQGSAAPFRLMRESVLSVEAALKRLGEMLGTVPDWAALQTFLPTDLHEPGARRSAIASTFAAVLEMAKRGRLDIRQNRAFGPIYLRRIGAGR